LLFPSKKTDKHCAIVLIANIQVKLYVRTVCNTLLFKTKINEIINLGTVSSLIQRQNEEGMLKHRANITSKKVTCDGLHLQKHQFYQDGLHFKKGLLLKGALNPNFSNLTTNREIETFWSHFLTCFC